MDCRFSNVDFGYTYGLPLDSRYAGMTKEEKNLNNMFKHRKSILIILTVIILIFLSQPVFGVRILFPTWIKDKIIEFLDQNPELSAADYKEGTILLIKPIATGVGDGRYEAGDIVEIRVFKK